MHFTFAVTTKKKTKVVEEKTREKPHSTTCPRCRWPTFAAAHFCAQCGQSLHPDERTPEGKRGWTVVSHDEDDEEVIPSLESSKPEEKPKMYHLRKGLLREAAGYGGGEKERERIKAGPEEVLAALPKMTREEKRMIQKALMKEERDAAYDRLQRSHLLPQYESSEDERDPYAAASGGYQAPITPKATPKKTLEHGKLYGGGKISVVAKEREGPKACFVPSGAL